MLLRYGPLILLVLGSSVFSVHCDWLVEINGTLKSDVTIEPSPTIEEENAKENITIGFLTSFREGVGKIISGAIPLAVEFVNK